MILADSITQDPETGKHTLGGLFNQLMSNEFPAGINAQVYIRLWNLESASHELGIRIVDRQGNIVGVLSGKMDPGEQVEPGTMISPEFGVALQAQIPAPGDYELQLFVDNQPTAHHPLVVRQA